MLSKNNNFTIISILLIHLTCFHQTLSINFDATWHDILIFLIMKIKKVSFIHQNISSSVLIEEQPNIFTNSDNIIFNFWKDKPHKNKILSKKFGKKNYSLKSIFFIRKIKNKISASQYLFETLSVINILILFIGITEMLIIWWVEMLTWMSKIIYTKKKI